MDTHINEILDTPLTEDDIDNIQEQSGIYLNLLEASASEKRKFYYSLVFLAVLLWLYVQFLVDREGSFLSSFLNGVFADFLTVPINYTFVCIVGFVEIIHLLLNVWRAKQGAQQYAREARAIFQNIHTKHQVELTEYSQILVRKEDVDYRFCSYTMTLSPKYDWKERRHTD